MGKVESLNNEFDLFIGGDAYRVCPLELRIKIKAMGKDGWKTLRKFDKLSDMAEYWSSLKAPLGPGATPGAVVVRECMEASQVLPPEAALPHTPQALVAQYGKALTGTLEVVRFGAMLADQDEALTKANKKAPQGRRGEESLKGYLEANCPTINYKTALGFKGMAEDVREYCKIPAKVPLALAMPQADGETWLPEGACPVPPTKLEKLQSDVWSLLDGKSARQLRLGLGEAESAAKGGQRPKEKHTEAEKHELRLKAAKLWWDGVATDMADQVSRLKSHMLLDRATLTSVLVKFDEVRASLIEAQSKGE